MVDIREFLETNTPFLFQNWQWLLPIAVACCVVIIIWRVFQRNGSTQLQTKREKLGDEHPMAEFQKESDFGNMAAPTLHPPDTPHIPYVSTKLTKSEMIERSKEFYQFMNKRRSIRDFSDDPIPIEVINNIIKTAGTSPSGAHTEPWTFVVVKDKETKAKIRHIIEQEEYVNYNHRMGEKWVQDLKFVGTDHQKPYLETAPYLILVFKQQYHVDKAGTRYAHYYFEVSTALACGVLVTSIHNAGLSTVVTTPLNAGGQLRELLGRPSNEKVMLLLPVGFPAEGAKVPDVGRKQLKDIMVVV